MDWHGRWQRVDTSTTARLFNYIASADSGSDARPIPLTFFRTTVSIVIFALELAKTRVAEQSLFPFTGGAHSHRTRYS